MCFLLNLFAGKTLYTFSRPSLGYFVEIKVNSNACECMLFFRYMNCQLLLLKLGLK
jgi:hypothetical protein